MRAEVHNVKTKAGYKKRRIVNYFARQRRLWQANASKTAGPQGIKG